MSIARRHRVGQGLQSSLKHSKKSNEINSSLKSKELAKEEEGSKVVDAHLIRHKVKNKIKGLFNKLTTCGMCEQEITASDKGLKLCTCNHNNFCESCLHHYVIYKVKNFEEVLCPQEDCKSPVDTKGALFKGLPIDIQRNFKKAQNFFETAKDPNSKLCPRPSCEGVIRLTSKQVMVCDECASKYCSQCLLAAHPGDCDQKEVEFFEKNLHYRQCKRCRFIIEKNQGCNHITCRCGYQFCYVCGADWKAAHYGDHDENGNLIERRAAAAPAAVANNNNNNYVPPGRLDCCTNCAGECCGTVLKAIAKFFLFILWTVLCLVIFAVKDGAIFCGVFLMTLLTGMFVFSVELVSECEGFGRGVAILLFPLMMVAGIIVSFGEAFIDIFPPVVEQTWDFFRGGLDGIYDA